MAGVLGVEVGQDGGAEGGDAFEFAGGGLLAETGEAVLETAEEAGEVGSAFAKAMA